MLGVLGGRRGRCGCTEFLPSSRHHSPPLRGSHGCLQADCPLHRRLVACNPQIVPSISAIRFRTLLSPYNYSGAPPLSCLAGAPIFRVDHLPRVTPSPRVARIAGWGALPPIGTATPLSWRLPTACLCGGQIPNLATRELASSEPSRARRQGGAGTAAPQVRDPPNDV